MHIHYKIKSANANIPGSWVFKTPISLDGETVRHYLNQKNSQSRKRNSTRWDNSHYLVLIKGFMWVISFFFFSMSFSIKMRCHCPINVGIQWGENHFQAISCSYSSPWLLNVKFCLFISLIQNNFSSFLFLLGSDSRNACHYCWLYIK